MVVLGLPDIVKYRSVNILLNMVIDMGYLYEKCIILGTGKFAFNCAKYMNEVYQLDCIYEYGQYMQSGLEALCNRSSFPYVKLGDKIACDRLMHTIIKSGKRTLIISASNTYIFPEFIIQCKDVKIVNYHPALLTKHLGRNVEAWSIYEQDDVTGVTWHEVTSEIDHGAVLAEQIIELDKSITSLKLMTKQYQVGFELFKTFIGGLWENVNIQKKMVSSYGKMHYSYEKPNDGVLDLNWEENRIASFLRSMDYGVLNVMGKPIFIENNLKYCWASYKILADTKCVTGEEYNDGSRVIERGSTVFLLQNIYIMDSIEGK